MSKKKSFFEKLLGGKKSDGCCNMEIVDNDCCCGEAEVQANDTDCKCDCCPSENSDN